MNKQIVLMLCLIYSSTAHLQKEDHIWISNFSSVDSCENSNFPDLCGSSVLDFNNLPPSVYKEEKLTLDFLETNSSICNEYGELILYCNGQSIHGPHHHWIDGAERVNNSPNWTGLSWENEFGETKPTGHRYVQGTGIFPIPESDPTEYIVIYTNFQTEEFELWSSRVVKDGDDYKAISVDSVFNKRYAKAGTLTACKHANGRDWWFMQFSRDTAYHYLIDPQGVRLDHFQKLPFEIKRSNTQVKFNQQGTRFAMHGRHSSTIEAGKFLMLADYDRCEGLLIEPELYELPIFNVLQSGMEFSPSGDLLYISTRKSITQMDLRDPDFFENKIEVTQLEQDSCHLFPAGDLDLQFGQMQLGPDNKIYVSILAQCDLMHRIEFPDLEGEACHVSQGVIKLPSYIKGTLPNVHTYRLGPLDGSACDTLGIDNHPVSRFWYEPTDSTEHRAITFYDVSYFRPESWSWTFGDGQSSSDRHPTHVYAQDGVYEVCLTVENENSVNTSCQTLHIGTVSTTEASFDPKVNIFPNPVEDYTRVVINGYLPNDARLNVYDVQGRKVASHPIQGIEDVVYLGALTVGTYIFTLVDGQTEISTGKIIKI